MRENTCTWKNCEESATHVEEDSNGRPWAFLCDEHHNELDASLEAMDGRQNLRCWVLAHGGASAMVRDGRCHGDQDRS